MYKPFSLSEQAQNVIRAIVDFSTRHCAIWIVVRASNGRKVLSTKAPFDADEFIRAIDYEQGYVDITICFTDREPKFYRIILQEKKHVY